MFEMPPHELLRIVSFTVMIVFFIVAAVILFVYWRWYEHWNRRR